MIKNFKIFESIESNQIDFKSKLKQEIKTIIENTVDIEYNKYYNVGIDPNEWAETIDIESVHNTMTIVLDFFVVFIPELDGFDVNDYYDIIDDIVESENEVLINSTVEEAVDIIYDYFDDIIGYDDNDDDMLSRYELYKNTKKYNL